MSRSDRRDRDRCQANARRMRGRSYTCPSSASASPCPPPLLAFRHFFHQMESSFPSREGWAAGPVCRPYGDVPLGRRAKSSCPSSNFASSPLAGETRRRRGTAPAEILYTQGPVARIEWQKATQILRAGNSASSHRCASPVMGSGADSPYQGEMARRARGGRVGEYGHGVSILSRPRRRFGYFAAGGKVTRPAGRSPT